MKKQITLIQQGDCLFRKLSKMPAGELVSIAKKRIVVAHGESGHSHVIEDEDAELIRIGERMLLKLTKSATLKHEEHGEIEFSPGIWEVGRVREFDWFSKISRQVMD